MFCVLILLAVFLSIRFLPLFWNFALQAYFEWESFVFVFLPSVSFCAHPSWASGLWLTLPSCSELPALNRQYRASVHSGIVILQLAS